MFFAWNFLLLWLTEPFPVITLIVRFKKFPLSPLSGNKRRIRRIAFVTFCESNAKALLTGKPIKNATCKQVLRPAGGIATLTLANTLRLFIRPLHPCESIYQASPQQCKVYIFCNLAIFISAKSL